MRAKLSPAFTGSKMKHMFALISQSGQQFVDHFLTTKQDFITVEMKDTFTRFTNDVIASTAFGVQCDSLDDTNNEFYLMGKEATNFDGFWKNLRIFGYILVPKLLKVTFALGICIFGSRLYFVGFQSDTISQRSQQLFQ